MSSVVVSFPGGVAVDATYKGHTIRTDQPIDSGGDDEAMSPFDVFFASIAACMGFYALRFCQERSLSTEGLGLTLEPFRDEQSKRVSVIRVKLATGKRSDRPTRAVLLAGRSNFFGEHSGNQHARGRRRRTPETPEELARLRQRIGPYGSNESLSEEVGRKIGDRHRRGAASERQDREHTYRPRILMKTGFKANAEIIACPASSMRHRMLSTGTYEMRSRRSSLII